MTRGQHEHPWLRSTSLQRIPGASTGGRIRATSVLWSSRPAAGAARSKVTSSSSTAGYARANAASSRVRISPAAATLRPDAQPPGHRAGRVPRRRHPAVQAGQRRPGGVQERRAGRGQHHAPAGPLQQLGADRVFQLPDLRGQDLLGDVHAPRGGGEARLLGDRDEVPQMPQFDVHRERNPNRRAITATVDTIASREA